MSTINLQDLISKQAEFIFDIKIAPIIGAMIESLAIPQIIDQYVGPLRPNAKLSTGMLAKGLIVNILYGRTPLVHVADSFKMLDCEVVFGKDVLASDFNDDRLGDFLDDMSDINCSKAFSEVCRRALTIHGASIKYAHTDSTAVSVEGEYKSLPLKDGFDITFGHPKNKRVDLKQLMIGATVQQNGLPIGGKGLAGNTSDAVYFRDAMDEMANFLECNLNTGPIHVVDAAGGNQEMFDKLCDNKMPAIIRLPETFTENKVFTELAWEQNQWIDIGPVASDPDKATKYRVTAFCAELGQNQWRLLVIHSSALEKAKIETAKRQLPKKQKKLTDAAQKLAKKSFESENEAKEAAETFIQDSISIHNPFVCTYGIQSKTEEKYEKRGKPTKDSKKVAITTYHAVVTIDNIDGVLYQLWLQKESCFVLVTNAPKARIDEFGVLKSYNDQWKIEDTFHFLKQPLILGTIWLHNKNRVKALVFVLLLAVTVAAYIRYRLAVTMGHIKQDEKILPNCQQIAETNSTETISETNTLQNKMVLENSISIAPIKTDVPLVGECQKSVILEMPVLAELLLEENKNPCAIKIQIAAPTLAVDMKVPAPRRLLTKDGRLVENPTYKVINDLLSKLKTKMVPDGNGGWRREFAYGTPVHLLNMLRNIGFDPRIYLEPFHPSMDLWKYVQS